MESHPLYKARAAKRLTMRKLSSLLEMGQYGHRRIYGWEHGETIPTLLYAKALATALDFESGQAVRQACQQWRQQHHATPSHLDPSSTHEAEHVY